MNDRATLADAIFRPRAIALIGATADQTKNNARAQRVLKKAGYGTTLVGKWHLGSLPDFGPHQSGYDHFYGFRGGAIDYFLHTGRNGSKDFWEEDERIEPEGYATTLLGDRAEG